MASSQFSRTPPKMTSIFTPLLSEEKSKTKLEIEQKLHEINQEMKLLIAQRKKFYEDYETLLSLKTSSEKAAREMNFKPQINLDANQRKTYALKLKLDPETSLNLVLAKLKAIADKEAEPLSSLQISLAEKQASLLAELQTNKTSAPSPELKKEKKTAGFSPK